MEDVAACSNGKLVGFAKDDRLYQGDDTRSRQQMLEALQLRFSLVGGLFDAILRSPTATVDWAVLLVQLVTAGVIDPSNNVELFATLQDMIATLLHSTQATDAQTERGSEDGKKCYFRLFLSPSSLLTLVQFSK